MRQRSRNKDSRACEPTTSTTVFSDGGGLRAQRHVLEFMTEAGTVLPSTRMELSSALEKPHNQLVEPIGLVEVGHMARAIEDLET